MADPFHFRQQRFRHVGLHHHHATDLAATPACRDRGGSPHQTPGLGLLHRIHFLLAVDDLEHQLADR